MNRRWVLTAGVAAAVVLAAAGAPATATVGAQSRVHPVAVDPEQECPNDGLGDLAPDGVAVVPSAARVTLGVLVLLDGVSASEGKAIVTRAQASYTPMNIRLAPVFETVAIPPDGKAADGQPTGADEYLLAQMRRVRPTLPPGIDVVHLLTSKDLVDDAQPDRGGTDSLAGRAACVGGVRVEGQQYSMTEARFRFAAENDPSDDFHSIAMAHEIGHLLGAHHEHGNCVEGRTQTPGGRGSCTAMFPVAVLDSARFGSVESAVIRGYAEAHAAP